MKRIGENVRLARTRAKLTQKQLAERTSVSRNYIAQIESGRKKPAIRMLNAISKATKAPLSGLLEGDEFVEKIKAELLERTKQVERELRDLLNK